MRKVKVVKMYTPAYYDMYGDYTDMCIMYPATKDWDEVDDKEFKRLQESLSFANQRARTQEYQYIVVEYDEDTKEALFEDHKEMVEHFKKQHEKEEKRKAEIAAKKEATALKRKQKQLEKLKKELGE